MEGRTSAVFLDYSMRLSEYLHTPPATANLSNSLQLTTLTGISYKKEILALNVNSINFPYIVPLFNSRTNYQSLGGTTLSPSHGSHFFLELSENGKQ